MRILVDKMPNTPDECEFSEKYHSEHNGEQYYCFCNMDFRTTPKFNDDKHRCDLDQWDKYCKFFKEFNAIAQKETITPDIVEVIPVRLL